MSAFKKLREANQARQREWDPDNKVTLSFRAAELAGEAGEACNVAKKIERERMGMRGSRATLDDLADELADVIISTDTMAMDLGIDLEAAVERKFNGTSAKHGFATRIEFEKEPQVVVAELSDDERRVLLKIHVEGGRAVLREPDYSIGRLIITGHVTSVYEMYLGGYTAKLTPKGKQAVEEMRKAKGGAGVETV